MEEEDVLAVVEVVEAARRVRRRVFRACRCFEKVATRGLQRAGEVRSRIAARWWGGRGIVWVVEGGGGEGGRGGCYFGPACGEAAGSEVRVGR